MGAMFRNKASISVSWWFSASPPPHISEQTIGTNSALDISRRGVVYIWHAHRGTSISISWYCRYQFQMQEEGRRRCHTLWPHVPPPLAVPSFNASKALQFFCGAL